jgi:hypothetical protein
MWVMADRHTYTASLRVLSTELRFSELAAALGDPTRGHDIGDPVSSRTDAKRRHSHWNLVADVDRERPLHERLSRWSWKFGGGGPGVIVTQ